ncbi:E3 ubiquitin-protein ligase [Trichophyton interdigitale]|nr:E3 ubiquitin-protein ligase [Trichophyton interdigitale]KAG5218603.1 E3 ubiquitin-protein ligase [Trichophyton interdigitale]KAG8207764.1 E3 ubiquitin-protein ligase [Trichophyton interdigitale]
MALAVPDGGLTLHRDAASSQFLRLNLPQSTLADLLQVLNDSSLPAAAAPRLRLGKHPSLLINSKSTPFHAYPQTSRSEIYQHGSSQSQNHGHGQSQSQSQSQDGGLYFSGVLSHSLEVQKAKEATAATDEALTNLERSLNAFEKGKESRRTPLIATIDQMRALGAGDSRSATGREAASLARKSTSRADQEKERFFKHANASRSTPASPALAPLSPLPPAAADRENQRLEAIRTPLIHLLAIRPVSAKFLASRTRCNAADVLALTTKLCTPNRLDGSKFDLKDKVYKDLDVWSFPYPSDEERTEAIENAISAFDRMRISKADRLWQTLLPKHERGKGKVLSRLNLRTQAQTTQQQQQQQSRLQAPEEGGGYGTGNESEGPTAPDHQSMTTTAATPTIPPAAAKPAAKKRGGLEKALSSKRGPKPKSTPAATLTGKVTKKTEKKTPAAGSAASLKSRDPDRFKSAEFILDSDEEEAAANSIVASSKPTLAATTTTTTTSTAQRGRPPKTKKVPVKRQPPSAISAPTTTTTTTTRPANVTSPLKPSPLGSSPPTNASDVDVPSGRPSSTKSRPHSNSHSSSSSSPLIHHLPRKIPPAQPAKSRPTPPSTATSTSTSASTSALPSASTAPAKPGALKRKTRPAEDTRPPPTSSTSTSSAIGLGIHASEPKRRRPSSISSTTTSSLSQPESMHSGSGSGSGSASPPISQTILRARLRTKSAQFKQYYAKYRLLHEEMMARSRNGMDYDIDIEQIRKLERQHAHLQKMKQEIWDEDRRLRMSS